MHEIAFFLGFLLVLKVVILFLGWLFALPVLLPPLRRWARSSGNARRATIAALGGVTFISIFTLSFLTITLLLATAIQLTTFYTNLAPGVIQEEIITELWLRQIVPQFLSNSCHTTQPICDFVDANTSPPLSFNYPALLFSLTPGFLITSVNIVLVWVSTRHT